jgi:hypothetical protein
MSGLLKHPLFVGVTTAVLGVVLALISTHDAVRSDELSAR